MVLENGVVVQSYLTDSGAFKASTFVQRIRDHGQRIRFCGTIAHHQNGVAERLIRTVSNMACAMILHASSHWKDGIDSSLWPLAVSYAVYIYNHIPNAQNVCPADLYTSGIAPRHRLRDLHTWGCPVYVLDPVIQAGRKLPRWSPRSRRGVFVGLSTIHSSEVPLVLNVKTGSITTQYHVVFDDKFSTVSSIVDDEHPPDHWESLCLDSSLLIPLEPDDQPFHLADDWLTDDEIAAKNRLIQHQDRVRNHFRPPMSPTTQLFHDVLATAPTSPPLLPVSTLPSTSSVPDLSTRPTPEGESQFSRPETEWTTVTSKRGTRSPSDGAPLRTVPEGVRASSVAPEGVQASSAVPEGGGRVSSSSTSSVSSSPLRRSIRSRKGKFRSTKFIDEAYLSSIAPNSCDAALLDAEIAALGVSSADKNHKFQLRDEGELGAFLGIQIEKSGPSTFILTQPVLTTKVFSAAGMTDCNSVSTPTGEHAIGSNLDGSPFQETWNYRTIVGMLMFLSSNTRPDIAFAVHQVA